jgi:hypothetical protein
MAAQIGRPGGQQNRHAVDGVFTPLPALDSVSGVMAAIAQVSIELHAKRLPPRIAAGLATLFNIQLGALRDEAEERQEEKLRRLEEKINKLAKKEAGEGVTASAAFSVG